MAFITSSADALTLLLEIDAGNSRRHRLDAAGRVYEHGAVDPLGESARNAHDHAPLTRSRQHARRGRFCGAQTARLSAWKVPRQRGALQIEIRRAARRWAGPQAATCRGDRLHGWAYRIRTLM